jgi:hypothetical protein
MKTRISTLAVAAMISSACVRAPAPYAAHARNTAPPSYAAAPPGDVAVTQRVDSTFAAATTPGVDELGAESSLLGDGSDQAAIASEPSAPLVALLPFQQMNHGSQPLRPKAAARRYGNLSPTLCSKELRNWKDSFKRVGAYKGIATPTRVIGPIEGVKFRVPGEKSKFGILDCRLALTLVEFARFLRDRDVTEVVVDNFYRLNARLPSARSKRSQHAYALAIDLRSFRLSDGRVWDIEKDWGASTDTEACGPQATLAFPSEHTEGLRTLVCELFAEQIFSHHLTPSHDMAHRNHLHLDIKRDAKSAVIK